MSGRARALLLTPPATAQTPVADSARADLLAAEPAHRALPVELDDRRRARPKSVRLYVSKDRGASWQLVADAQSQLLWRSTTAPKRTANSGLRFARPRASGARMPPSMPADRRAAAGAYGRSSTRRCRGSRASPVNSLVTNSLEVRWRIADANLGTHSCIVEVQIGRVGDWQPVPLRGESEVSRGRMGRHGD